MPDKNKVPFRKAVCKLAHHSNIVCWLTEGLYSVIYVKNYSAIDTHF